MVKVVFIASGGGCKTYRKPVDPKQKFLVLSMVVARHYNLGVAGDAKLGYFQLKIGRIPQQFSIPKLLL